jgi:hypothetical protein
VGTVISRAKPKPKDDTQFGDWEIWNGQPVPTDRKLALWFVGMTRQEANEIAPWDARSIQWHDGIIAFRRVIEPVRGEVVMTGYSNGIQYWFSSDGGINNAHRLTLPTTNGELTPGKYTGPDGAVIIVEVLG